MHITTSKFIPFFSRYDSNVCFLVLFYFIIVLIVLHTKKEIKNRQIYSRQTVVAISYYHQSLFFFIELMKLWERWNKQIYNLLINQCLSKRLNLGIWHYYFPFFSVFLVVIVDWLTFFLLLNNNQSYWKKREKKKLQIGSIN